LPDSLALLLATAFIRLHQPFAGKTRMTSVYAVALAATACEQHGHERASLEFFRIRTSIWRGTIRSRNWIILFITKMPMDIQTRQANQHQLTGWSGHSSEMYSGSTGKRAP